jgi:hypothetical protein
MKVRGVDMKTPIFSRLFIMISFVFSSFAAFSSVDGEEKSRAEALMTANGIEFEGKYTLTRFSALSDGNTRITVQQIFEGFTVFDHELNIYFDANNKVEHSLTGSVFLLGEKQTFENLGIGEKDGLISQHQAIEIFSNEAAVLTIPRMNGQGTGNQVRGPRCAQDLDSINSELGIYQMQVAWRVQCEEDSYPLMYIDAVKGTSLYFDSGIRS